MKKSKVLATLWGEFKLDWNKVDKVCSYLFIRTVPGTLFAPSSEWVNSWTCNGHLPRPPPPTGALSSLSRSYCVNPEERVTTCTRRGWDVLGRLRIGWYWTWASGNWLGEGFWGREWQVLPAVTAACVEAQWQGLCGKRWAAVLNPLRDLFICANIFYISLSLSGHGYNIVNYVTDPQLRKGQGSEWTISPVVSGLCFVSICLPWYSYTYLAHGVCVYVCTHTHVCAFDGRGPDMVCNMRKEDIWCLFRHMHPSKGEVSVSVLSHIKHEALNNIKRASLSPPQKVH